MITGLFRRPLVAAGLGLALAAALPAADAAARGPGNYVVAGKDGTSGGGYTGTATLTQTSDSTWRIVWRIGGQVWNGFGIGDGKIVALNFSGHGRTGVMLLVAKDDDSGYQAAWAYTGDRTVGLEDWSRQ